MIAVTNLNKKYKDNIIFSDFSYKFVEGKINFIIGPSGRGKTTLLNILSGIESADSGTIKYSDDIRNLKDLRKNSSVLFQNYALLDEKSIDYNLNISLHKFSKPEKIDALKKVGITKSLNTKIYTLSGGEQQRVAIAKALLKKSQFIFADEPTGNLDKQNSDNIMGILRELSLSRTIIIVTHDENLVNKNKGDQCLDLNNL